MPRASRPLSGKQVRALELAGQGWDGFLDEVIHHATTRSLEQAGLVYWWNRFSPLAGASRMTLGLTPAGRSALETATKGGKP